MDPPSQMIQSLYKGNILNIATPECYVTNQSRLFAKASKDKGSSFKVCRIFPMHTTGAILDIPQQLFLQPFYKNP